ncbi:MAG: hypothetical protein JWO94_3305, partial [Verrucomicrobiaceae bacterium]|nr:hypothetical protein [Verrucomicrobiaceae bacterium]
MKNAVSTQDLLLGLSFSMSTISINYPP